MVVGGECQIPLQCVVDQVEHEGRAVSRTGVFDGDLVGYVVADLGGVNIAALGRQDPWLEQVDLVIVGPVENTSGPVRIPAKDRGHGIG